MSNESEASPPRPLPDDDVKESPTVMTPATPKTLGGNKLIKRVGVGGMGEVWLGQDIKLHRQVAIKVMLTDLIKTTPDAAARFYQEARAVAKLNHQNIIQIFQIGEEKGLLFFSMEWVDGESLQEYLKRVSSLDTVEALDIAIQMVDGLAFACQNQVIHRDVKPANVMLDKKHRVKITDFGLAKIQDSDLALTSSGMSMGSPNYMSPEMAKGESVNHRADIYAVGITLYQMLTGGVPFTGPSATVVLLKHIQEPLPIPRALEEKAGRFLIDVLRKMTEKDAEFRYQTYETLRADLVTSLDRARGTNNSSALQTTPLNAQSLAVSGRSTIHVEATPLSNPPTAGLPAVKQRNPAPFVIGVVLAVVALFVVGGGIVSFVMSKKDSVPSAAALLGGGTALKGQAFLKVDRDIDPIAGQTILLYTGADRDRLMKIRKDLDAQQKTISESAAAVKSLLEDIRAASSSNERVVELKDKLVTLKEKVEKIKSDGGAATNDRDRYAMWVKSLKTQFEDFKAKGYNSYRLTDPAANTTIQLSTDGGRRESSIQVFENTIRSYEETMTAHETRRAKLALDLAAANKEIEETETKINGRGPSGDTRPLEEKRRAFAPEFQKLVAAQAARLKTIDELEAVSAPGAAEVKTDTDGKFEFKKVADGTYIIKASYTTRALPQESRLPYKAVWLEPVNFKSSEQIEVKLTQDNVLVYTRKDALDRLAKPFDSQQLPQALKDFLSDDFKKGDSPSFEGYVDAAISP